MHASSPWVRRFLVDLAEDGRDPNGEISLVIPGSEDHKDNHKKHSKGKDSARPE